MTSSSPSQSAPDEAALPLYRGSCHCGYVTYTCELDFQTPHPSTGAILTRCNCTICHKSGMLLATPFHFTLLSPPRGEADITEYTYRTGKVKHSFCPKCGIRCFLHGTYDGPDGAEVSFRRVNVLTLDGRDDGQPMDDLRKVEVLYWDGKTGDWSKGPSKEPYDGGAR